jgi:hypothetical protein
MGYLEFDKEEFLHCTAFGSSVANALRCYDKYKTEQKAGSDDKFLCEFNIRRWWQALDMAVEAFRTCYGLNVRYDWIDGKSVLMDRNTGEWLIEEKWIPRENNQQGEKKGCMGTEHMG